MITKGGIMIVEREERIPMEYDKGHQNQKNSYIKAHQRCHKSPKINVLNVKSKMKKESVRVTLSRTTLLCFYYCDNQSMHFS